MGTDRAQPWRWATSAVSVIGAVALATAMASRPTPTAPATEVSIDGFSVPAAELTETNLTEWAEVVVDAVVVSKTTTPIGDYAHTIGSPNAEQQAIIDAGYPIDVVDVTVVATHKGAASGTVNVVAGSASNDSAANLDSVGLIDVVDLQVGFTYRFYLINDPIWFDSGHHTVLIAAMEVV